MKVWSGDGNKDFGEFQCLERGDASFDPMNVEFRQGARYMERSRVRILVVLRLKNNVQIFMTIHRN